MYVITVKTNSYDMFDRIRTSACGIEESIDDGCFDFDEEDEGFTPIFEITTQEIK